MSYLPIRRLALVILTLLGGVVAPVAAVLISLHTSTAHPDTETYFYLIDGMLTQAVLVPLTLLMVFRRPERTTTVVFVLLTVLSGGQQLAGAYATEALLVAHRLPLPGGVLAQFAQGVFQTWVALTFLLLLAIFPDGRAVSPRWNWLVWCVVGLYLLLPLQLLMTNQPFTNDPDPTPQVLLELAGPLSASPQWLKATLGGSAVVLTVPFLLGVVPAVFLRFRRSRGVERQQVKWFSYAVVLGVVYFLVPLPFDHEQQVDLPLLYWLGRTVFNPYMIVPAIVIASMALAVLRFGLYDIDRIISRTVSYTLVVGVLAGVFAAGSVWLPTAMGLDDTFAVAGATLAAAALFNPLRKAVQRQVDRHFDRTHYDAQRMMETFSDSLKERVDPEGVVEGWVGVIRDTMQPAGVGVWVKR